MHLTSHEPSVDFDQGAFLKLLINSDLSFERRSSELCHRDVNCVLNVLVKMAKLLFLLIAVVLALVSFSVSVLGGNDKNKHEDERKKEVNLHPDLE